tara:strand:- start:10 stop:996 length:987 start_codon:yes stop_codon:yes gene_type:complete
MEIKEFSRIKKFFRPLTSQRMGAMELLDDAALVPTKKTDSIVVSTDALVEKIHFHSDERADFIARKALRTNLSDLAAMGSKPFAYNLALIIGKKKSINIDQWLKLFSKGLAVDQKKFGIELIGGDTVTSFGPTSICISIFGTPNPKRSLLRRGAKVGDGIFVSGTIGDAALGLTLRGNRSLSCLSIENSYCISRYRIPRPRIDLGLALGEVASAAMDISDGLFQDLSHLCGASNVGGLVHANKIPLSKEVSTFVKEKKFSIEQVITGGDDYELIFTAPVTKEKSIFNMARVTKTRITRIGTVQSGEGISIFDKNGDIIPVSKAGYSHE